MTYYPPDIIKKVKEIDLYTYLKNNDPDELVHFSNNTFVTRTHDSLKISNGMWYWFSRGFGGKSALDYLVKVEEYTFTNAVEKLLGVKCSIKEYSQKCKKKFELPPKAPNNSRVIYYLKSRGIDENLILECIDKDLIYQDNHQNVVFVGYDPLKKPRYAMCRGTNASNFKHEVSGSHKAFSFQLESMENNDSVHLFESAIDLLSYATLMILENKAWYNESLLSLAGVYRPAKNIEDTGLPLALNFYLNQHPNVKKIYLHLDNDIAGKESAQTLKYLLSSRYEIIDSSPSMGKDVNDFLCIKLGIKNMKYEREER